MKAITSQGIKKTEERRSSRHPFQCQLRGMFLLSKSNGESMRQLQPT